ncbi:MAG TPA: N-acetyl-gamma-glutamyl-phosphate reductase [Spirochaetia bacterium]|nr:N-acetyl-gamma-glutamyl-phosphate reductase [Spirochaetia bacterium]
MKAAILGTTGYTGLVLMRILTDHPDITEILPVSSSQAGTPLVEADPGIGEETLAKTEAAGGNLMSLEAMLRAGPDIVFAALPHLKSAEICAPLFGKCPVIDLSADFRIKDHGIFAKAYGVAPPRPDLLSRAVYGLCEWNREAIRRADLIANPGCYPTATLLPILPLISTNLIDPDITVNALSGISGAGRSAKVNMLFGERSENMNAYSPGKTHRHAAEIQSQLDERSSGFDMLFTPHLVPVKQGMVVTAVVNLKARARDEDIETAFENAYGSEPFIRLQRVGIPESRQVRNTNRCDIAWHREGRRLILFSVIDNLLKGASGQAVQNMNIRFGLPETAGLKRTGEF